MLRVETVLTATLAAGLLSTHAFSEEPKLQWACNPSFRFTDASGNSYTKSYAAVGTSRADALNAALNRCGLLNSVLACVLPGSDHQNCASGPVCRVLAPHSKNHFKTCLSLGYAGYDSNPETSFGIGACYKTVDCQKYRPGIDAF